MKLNSTGSLSFSDGKYWSYSTKMSDTFNGYRLFNKRYYSATTAKHQAVIRRKYNYDIALDYCPYGDWDCKEVLEKELNFTKDNLATRRRQRKTDKQREDVKRLEHKIQLINKILEV